MQKKSEKALRVFFVEFRCFFVLKVKKGVISSFES